MHLQLAIVTQCIDVTMAESYLSTNVVLDMVIIHSADLGQYQKEISIILEYASTHPEWIVSFAALEAIASISMQKQVTLSLSASTKRLMVDYVKGTRVKPIYSRNGALDWKLAKVEKRNEESLIGDEELPSVEQVKMSLETLRRFTRTMNGDRKMKIELLIDEFSFL